MTGHDSQSEPGHEITHFPVSDIESIAKAGVRAARPGDRDAMWKTYLAAVRDAAEHSPDLMPWEDWQSVTRLTTEAGRHILLETLRAAPREEQERLGPVMAREALKAEQRIEAGEDGTAVTGYARRCAHCGEPVPAERGPQARYCKPSHRQAAWKAVQRAKAAKAARQG